MDSAIHFLNNWGPQYITLCTERAPFGWGTGAIGVAGPGLISAIGCLGTSGTAMINLYHHLGKMV